MSAGVPRVPPVPQVLGVPAVSGVSRIKEKQQKSAVLPIYLMPFLHIYTRMTIVQNLLNSRDLVIHLVNLIDLVDLVNLVYLATWVIFFI